MRKNLIEKHPLNNSKDKCFDVLPDVKTAYPLNNPNFGDKLVIA